MSKLHFPKIPSDKYYGQCYTHGNIKLSWCYEDQEERGTYWVTNAQAKKINQNKKEGKK